MIAKLKQLFKTKDEKKLDEATEEFDVLMDAVEKDEVDLANLDGHVRAELDETNKKVEEDIRGVDDAVDKKAA